MIKRFFSFAALVLLAAACTDSIDLSFDGLRKLAQKDQDVTVFYATIEGNADSTATKVYADDQLLVLWNADDRIAIYNNRTYGDQYRFDGPDGATAGTFKKIETSDFVASNPLNAIYAVYPFDKNMSISNSGVLSLNLPSIQYYKEDSFGLGANTMVSVSKDNYLMFKNLGGYLSFKFYGVGVTVKSIMLKGNNNEKLAGPATVVAAEGGAPTLTLGASAANAITLSCGDGVALSASAEQYLEFWFVVPPTTFTQGFTVSVTDELGGVFTKSTSQSLTISRNTISRMAPMEVTPDYNHSYIPFADANFKAYCVENFDNNRDGEISILEAQAVTDMISVCTDNIASLDGIGYFNNIKSLNCSGSKNSVGQLTDLDVSSNTALTMLHCQNNQLKNLDVTSNVALTVLDCSRNLLTSLDVSGNTVLTELSCAHNQLSSLDVSKNPELTSLTCNNNQLDSLDVSKNTALEWLMCYINQLTNLDVSRNTALTMFSCYSNQLKSLDVSNNIALTLFNCSHNQLTSLDVRKNTALTVCLQCNHNQITSLDVSNNTALEILYCYSNQLMSLDVSKNTALKVLDCYSNQLLSLDVSNNAALEELYCEKNQLQRLNVSYNTALTQFLCHSNPGLKAIWIRPGQTFKRFEYDSNVATIYDCFANFAPFESSSEALADEVIATTASAYALVNSIKNLKDGIEHSSTNFYSFTFNDSVTLFNALLDFAKAREDFLDFVSTIRPEDVDPQNPSKRDSSMFYYSQGRSGSSKPIFGAVKFSSLTWDALRYGEYEYTTQYPGNVPMVTDAPDFVVNAFANIVDQLGSELSSMFDFVNDAVVEPTAVTDLSSALYGIYKIDSWINPTKVILKDGSEYVPKALTEKEIEVVRSINRYIDSYNLCWNNNATRVTKDTPAVDTYIKAMISGNTSAIADAKRDLFDFIDEHCPTNSLNP